MVRSSCFLLPYGSSVLLFFEPIENTNSHRVRGKFIDEYRLTAVAGWIITPRLWDTTIVAEVRTTPSIEFGLGPNYAIDNSLGNPFYFN